MPLEGIDRSLAGIVVVESRSRRPIDLGALGRSVVTLIRHRY